MRAIRRFLDSISQVWMLKLVDSQGHSLRFCHAGCPAFCAQRFKKGKDTEYDRSGGLPLISRFSRSVFPPTGYPSLEGTLILVSQKSSGSCASFP